MKLSFLAAMLAVALILPAGAFAGELQSPMFLGIETQALHLTPQQQQSIERVWASAHARIRQLHVDGRNQVLSSLTPQQRSLLAQVVGNLAIAPNPDREAAAKQIQAALTPQQTQHIISLHSAMFTSLDGILQSAKAQADSYLTADQRQKVQQEMSVHFGMGHAGMGPEHMAMGQHVRSMGGGDENPATEAGHILLGLATGEFTGNMEYKVRVIHHSP